VEFEVVYEIWDAIARLLDNPIVRVISYVVSPILAILAFLWNRKDRREIIDKSTKLGRLESEVESAHTALREKERHLQTAEVAIEQRDASIRKLEKDLRRITEGSQELWKLRPAKAFQDYLTWLRDPAGAKLITFGNLKGGVGKTTLAANFAAYLSHARNKPVLLVDLDYQGSLSNMLMLANEKDEVESRIDQLFDGAADLATIDRAAEHLAPKLSRAWLVPANYTFAQLENRLLLQWLLQDDGGVDVRFRLASALLPRKCGAGMQPSFLTCRHE
jgi:hypothetical protein